MECILALDYLGCTCGVKKSFLVPLPHLSLLFQLLCNFKKDIL